MWDLSSINWDVKYKAKVQSSRKRGIDFKLTQEDFIRIYEVNGGVCDYTGEPLNFTHEDPLQASLERIDPYKPYEYGNICVISMLANKTKGFLLETKANEGKYKITNHHREIIPVICKVLEDKELLDNIRNKYIGELPLEQNTSAPNNPEIVIARLYAGFGNFIEDKCGSTYNLSYNDYKKLISRKKCQLTGRKLPEDLSQIGLFVIDKSQDVSKENILVTSKDVQNALDTMIVSTKLTLKELKTLCKMVGK